ncbi:hypothetical protein D3C87_1608020 [compost metagenome]
MGVLSEEGLELNQMTHHPTIQEDHGLVIVRPVDVLGLGVVEEIQTSTIFVHGFIGCEIAVWRGSQVLDRQLVLSVSRLDTCVDASQIEIAKVIATHSISPVIDSHHILLDIFCQREIENLLDK